jgi:Flp pilus assembly protein TadD
MRPTAKPRFKLSPQARWIACAIALFTVLLFLTGKSNAFVNWDDEQNFLRNAGMRVDFLNHMRWAWGTSLLGVFQPLVWNLLWLQTRLGGESAELIHWVSALLHGAITFGIFVFTLRLAHSRGESSSPSLLLWTALGTLWFALHPLRVETVAWASCQPYLWSVGFGMFSIWFYWNAFESTGAAKRSARVWAATFFTAGLLCKAILFCVPGVLVVFHLAFSDTKENWKAWLRADWFYWVGAAAILALALFHREIAIDLRQDQIGTGFAFWLTPFLVVFEFVSKSLVPVQLSALYPLSQAGSGIFPLVVCTTLLGMVFLTRKRGVWLFAGFLFVLLAPGISAAITERAAFADRFAYLPAMGVVVAGVPWLAARLPQTSWVLSLGSTTLVALGIWSLGEIGVWKNSETLWRHAIESGQESGKTWSNRGTAFLEMQDVSQAQTAFRTALQFDQRLPEAHNGLALCFSAHNDFASARSELEIAIAQKPLYPEAISNLAFVLSALGKHTEGLAVVERALALEPYNRRMHENRGRILDKLERIAESEDEFRFVLQSGPGDAEAYNLLGSALLKAGKSSEAVEVLGQGVAIDPSLAGLRYNYALSLKETGEPAKAEQALRAVLQAAPNFEPAAGLLRELTTDSQAREN